MFNRSHHFVRFTGSHLYVPFLLVGCVFSLMTLGIGVHAQEGANDPVANVEATNVTVWRDAVSTGSVTITCTDTKGNPVPNVDVGISIASPGMVATSSGFSNSTGGTTDSNGTVTVTVKSVDFTLVGNDATVTLTATAQGVKGTGTVTLKGALQFLANNVDATNKTNSCNIGERQALTANMFSGAQVFDTWTASGATPIGGWDGMSSPKATTTTPFPRDTNSESTASLYLTTTGSDTTTLTAVTANATATASTSFTVSEPKDFAFSAQQNIPAAGVDVLALGVYGATLNKSDPGGIYFTGSGGAGGTLSFGQILNTMNLVFTAKNGNVQTIPPKATTDGLDVGFPYPPTRAGSNTTNDSPSSNNQGPYTADLNYKAFSATMYLMWTSNIANSIPIPVEKVSWSFYAEATYNATTGAGTLAPGGYSPAKSNISGTPVNQGVLTWTTIWNTPHA